MTRKTLFDTDSPSGTDSTRPRRNLHRSWRMGALAAVAALGLAACVNNDASRADVVNSLTDAGLPQSEAECVGDAFAGEQGSAGLARVQEEGENLGGFTGFSQEQLNEISDADSQEDLEELDEAPIVDQIVRICRDGDAGGDAGTTDTTGEGEAPEDGDDTTTTTDSGDEG